jgi:hypothetical protein
VLGAAPRAAADPCARTPVHAGAQVHPLIAQRWVGRLKQSDRSGKLQAVMCANDAYLPGRVNFSVRRASSSTDLIALLKEAADGSQGLREALGEDFARCVGVSAAIEVPGGGRHAPAGCLARVQPYVQPYVQPCTRARVAGWRVHLAAVHVRG